jgi:lantibiotic transport system permease protein
MNLMLFTRGELKTRRMSRVFGFILMAVFIPITLFLALRERQDIAALTDDPWNGYFQEGFQGFCLAVLPLFVIGAGSLLAQGEYRNLIGRQVTALPRPLAAAFFYRFLNLHLLIVLFFVAYNVLTAATVMVMGTAHPSLNLWAHNFDWVHWLKANGTAYGSIMALSAIQFWLGLRFRGFVTPIAIGLGLWLAGGLLVFELQWPHADLFPHAYATLGVLDRYQARVPFILEYSLVYTALFLLLALADFNRHRVSSQSGQGRHSTVRTAFCAGAGPLTN